MLDRILPAQFDNTYRGHVVALWLFVPIVVMKLGIALLHVFSADGGAQSISTIPLDAYPSGAAQNIVALFSRVGVEQLVLGVMFVVALVRYRAMIPLLYLVVVTESVANEAVRFMKPLALAGASGARTPALVVMIAGVVGFLLSVAGKRYRAG